MGTQFKVLGPLEVLRDDVVLTLTSLKQRLLLARLLLNANEVVAVGALTEALWSGRPPATTRDVLQNYVSQLRKIIEPSGTAAGEATLRTVTPGYRLEVDPDDLDAVRFERLTGVGCEHLQRRDPTSAMQALCEAESLWRGPAFADLAGEPAVRGEAERLEALRLVAFDARTEAAIALGHPGHPLISDLEALLRAHPFRERTWAQLMRCLYRDGRQADTLPRVPASASSPRRRTRPHTDARDRGARARHPGPHAGPRNDVAASATRSSSRDARHCRRHPNASRHEVRRKDRRTARRRPARRHRTSGYDRRTRRSGQDTARH